MWALGKRKELIKLTICFFYRNSFYELIFRRRGHREAKKNKKGVNNRGVLLTGNSRGAGGF